MDSMASDDRGGERPPGIAEFLTAARWKHALFTTYALSLSYFESEVLRPLLQQGCDDIWLVCDAQGYRSSVLERRSMRVGQEYRIVPVALPHGVFHAKCIHLVSDDEQLLLVGSGNVTFGGHGRNVEVFEALVPNAHATAFADFSNFLETLGTQPGIQMARRDWIDDFAGRASRAAAAGADRTMQPHRLIHPLERTAIEQLGEIASPLGACEQVKVISPYHDPDGAAVQALLDAVDAERAVVAVTAEESSPFPFAEAELWRRVVTPGRPKIDGKRFVHAKWIECDFADAKFVLSGSFNTTRKALGTTENVELGVLRHVRKGEQFIEWDDCTAPRFEPAERMPSGLGQAEIVYASLDRNDPRKLKGRLISFREVAGSWHYRIVQADGRSHTGDVEVQLHGDFAIVNPELELFAELPALQIVLIKEKEEREARGWVHNEMLLSVGARRRLTAGALSRLMRREGSDDDIQALLDYLSVAADKHLRIFDLPIAAKTGGDESPDEAGAAGIVRVRLGDLAPVEEVPGSAGRLLAARSSVGDQFEAALTRLRRMVLGHGRARAVASQNGLASAILAEDESGESRRQTPEEIAYSLGLNDFENAITAMLEDCCAQTDRMYGLLTIQFEIGMWMRIHRLEDIEGAFEFMGSWLRRTARRTTHPQDRVTALSQHFVTATAIRASFVSEERKTQELVELHDDLEKFFEGAVDQSSAFASLIDDTEKGFAAALAHGLTSLDLKNALSEVLATRTRRQQLEEALRLRSSGQAIPADWAVFQSATGKALHESMHSPNWEKRVKRAVPNFYACSHCYCCYPPHERSIYKHERIGRCIHCGKFSLDLSP